MLESLLERWGESGSLAAGVLLGSFIAVSLFDELKLEGFEGGPGMRRYIAGTMLMGFGGMLAGGCDVGVGLSGAAVFTLTTWVTLIAMWASAALTDRLLDQQAASPLDQSMPSASVGAR